MAEEQMVEIKELLRDVAEHIREGKQTALLFEKNFPLKKPMNKPKLPRNFFL